jgi:ferredoxin
MSFEHHPSVQAHRQRTATLTISAKSPAGAFDAAELRELCRASGADDVGFVCIDDPLLAEERHRIEAAFPGVRTLIPLCARMAMDNVRSPLRSVANQTFHNTGHEVDDICRRIVLALQGRGVRACNPSMAFPMEIHRIPDDRPWIVSHKLTAEAGGLGVRGIHRSVIHPKFGSFILLGTVLIDREVNQYSERLNFNPCVECKLCVAACPVGAIKPDGHFDTAACTTHNYREFLGGFTDWVETVASSGSIAGYRNRVADGETLSMWQSLAFGPNYKAAYCLAVCPAGDDVLGPFIDERAEHVRQFVRPLTESVETLYVVRGSDAEDHARKRFPQKSIRYVKNGMRPTTAANFLSALSWLFQRGQSAGLSAVYHFRFSGRETIDATVTIRDQTIDVRSGLHDTPSVTIRADASSWVKFLRGERPLWRLLMTRSLRLSPMPRGAKLLGAFARCFPS